LPKKNEVDDKRAKVLVENLQDHKTHNNNIKQEKKKITLEEEKIIFFGKGKNSARVNEDISIKLGKEEIDTLHFSEKHKMKENKMNTEEKNKLRNFFEY